MFHSAKSSPGCSKAGLWPAPLAHVCGPLMGGEGGEEIFPLFALSVVVPDDATELFCTGVWFGWLLLFVVVVVLDRIVLSTHNTLFQAAKDSSLPCSMLELCRKQTVRKIKIENRSVSLSHLLEGLCILFGRVFKMSGKMPENKLGCISLRVTIKTWNGRGLFRQIN